jgi:signal transduction histidine kinase
LRSAAGGGPTWSTLQVAAIARFSILGLVFVVAAFSPQRSQALLWFPLLLVLGVISSIRGWPGRLGLLLRTATALATVAAVLESGNADSPLFPNLIAPAFAGGLVAGSANAIVPTGLAAIALLVGGEFGNGGDALARESALWVVLALAAGLAGAWIRLLLAPSPTTAEHQDTSYAAAYRLLAQLRPVARQLSVGLDPGTIAEGLLESLREVCDFDRGAVFVRTGGGRLIGLAGSGIDRTDWEVDVTDEGPFAEAWLTQRTQRLNRQLSGRPGSGAVVPLVIGLRTFGLVGLETDHRSFVNLDVAELTRITGEAALRLETALLFDEVRGVATAEERRRVAREIHDGIAQELSYLGYFVDGLAAEARGNEELSQQLKELRQEITRIVSELRLSIFDLRSEVDVHGGLGAALSDYVRSVGRQSALTVHLSLTEAANRLPAETEAELLRIAQEAITNARKHANAENLWVTLEVEPPAALLRVEDDGRGLGQARDDSYGLQIMRERAKRLRTTVLVAPREPCGTQVEVSLAGGPRRGTTLGESHGEAGLEELPQV